MSLKIRLRRLERLYGLHRTTPPIAFFDRILAGTVTNAERKRWQPWFEKTFPDIYKPGGALQRPANSLDSQGP